MRATLF